MVVLEALQGLSPSFLEAVLYFFNLKSLLPAGEFESFRRASKMMENVYLFLMGLLKGRSKGQDSSKRVTEVVLNGVGFLIELAA